MYIYLHQSSLTSLKVNGGATVVGPVSGYNHPAISFMFNRPAETSSLSDLLVQPDSIKTVHVAGADVGTAGGSFIMAISSVWAIRRRMKILYAAKPDRAFAQEKEDDLPITQELSTSLTRAELDQQR